MKRNSASQSGLFNPRVLVAFALCSVGVLLAIVGFAGTLPSALKGSNPQSLGESLLVNQKARPLRGDAPAAAANLPLAPAAAGDWSIVTSPNSGTRSNVLRAVTCVSASDCWAVGQYYTGSVYQTLIERWDGTSWAIVTSPNTSSTQSNYLRGVTCASTSDCWAAGYYTSNGFNQTLIEHWDGISWAIIPSPSTLPTKDNYLNGVACVSASDCWVAGFAIASDSSISKTLLEHWNGTSWTIVASPNTSATQSNLLNGVACASASDCSAGGYYYTDGLALQTLVEHWDGTSWAIVASPNPVPTDSNNFNGVACVPSSDCWAVGGGSHGAGFSATLTERWDGTSWAIVTSPNTSSTQFNLLFGVTCASVSDCWAVGYYSTANSAQSGANQTLTERWDGSSWTLVPSPNTSATQHNVLYGVTCASASDCWAVGYGANASGVNQTLVERFTPPATPIPSRLYVAEYALNDGRIFSMNLDGSDPVTVVSPPAAEWLLVGVDVDPANGKLYWSNGNFNSSTIRRADTNGANSELLLSGLKLVRGMSLDTANGKFYWANSPSAGNASGLIERANLDGTGRETVYTQDPYDPVLSYVGPPTVDTVNGYVYFCADQEIRRVRLDGTGTAETVVKGLNTTVGVALDVGSNYIYFIDANTNTDFLGRANLDGTDFRVLLDQTPGVSASSLMFDLKIDLAGGKAYWTNDLGGNVGVVQRVGLAGGELVDIENIYVSLEGRSPTGLSFNEDPPQPIVDCNQNSIRDLDDVANGASQDCNRNGIPDECETAPCVIEHFLVDNGTVPGQAGRTLSGDPNTGFEVFQPFDVTGSEVIIERIGLDGWTVNYHPSGFQVTLFPDDDSGSFPNETAPIQTAPLQFRFSPSKSVWVDTSFEASLPQGRYWIRITSNDVNHDAVVRVGTSGPQSFSRRLSTGEIINSSFSIALRLGAGPISAVSRKTHGPAGDFDINLPLTGDPGIECRSGGTDNDYQVVFTFPTAVTLNDAAVNPGTDGSASVAGPPTTSPDGTEVAVNLTGVSNAQTITVTLLGVNAGTSPGDVTVPMGILVGDTTGNGSVNSSDISQTKSRSGQAPAASNFRSDVTVNGSINSSDIALTKSKSGTALP